MTVELFGPRPSHVLAEATASNERDSYMNRTRIAVLIGILGATAALVGCGGSSTATTTTSSDTDSATTATTTSATAGTPVAVTLGSPKEFSVTLDKASVPAGSVTFNVTNGGKMMHELVIVPAPNGAAALKDANGEAKEDGAAGEVPDLAVGKSGSITVDLKPGKYVLLCNLPGHFAGGMWVDFTVA